MSIEQQNQIFGSGTLNYIPPKTKEERTAEYNRKREQLKIDIENEKDSKLPLYERALENHKLSEQIEHLERLRYSIEKMAFIERDE